MSTQLLSKSQVAAVKAVRSALGKAKRAGLVLRVYDGAVLLATRKHLEDSRYQNGCEDMTDWMDECSDVTNGIHADGGAGV